LPKGLKSAAPERHEEEMAEIILLNPEIVNIVAYLISIKK